MALVTNVVRRGGRYQFRCRVPADFVAKIGRREVSRTLGTSDPVIARRRSARLAILTRYRWSALRYAVTLEEMDAQIRRWLKGALLSGTLKDAMRDAEIEERLQHRLIGHNNAHVSERYGKGPKPPQLFAAMSKIKLPVDLSHLLPWTPLALGLDVAA